MKKSYLIVVLSMFLVASCSKEQNESDVQGAQEFETINYTFNGNTYKLDFERNAKDELVPVDTEILKQIDQIIDENENLIFHDVDENNIILFQTEVDLHEYLESKGTPLSTDNSSSKNSALYDVGNLSMFIDSYYGGPVVYWQLSGSGSPAECYQQNSPEIRLKNFSTTGNWIVRQNNFTVFCNLQNTSFGNNPNDKVSSLIVRNVFGRFYEHANYGGRSITRDARYGSRVSEYNRLKSVRYRGRWDNRISSAKLSF